jgi:hypothetical protein
MTRNETPVPAGDTVLIRIASIHAGFRPARGLPHGAVDRRSASSSA